MHAEAFGGRGDAGGQLPVGQFVVGGDRFTILAMLALAILTLTTVNLATPADPALIALTVPETRRLITALLHHPPDLGHLLRWSTWRRLHQAQARQCTTATADSASYSSSTTKRDCRASAYPIGGGYLLGFTFSGASARRKSRRAEPPLT